MRVITLKNKERLHIGQNICIQLSKVRPQQVKLNVHTAKGVRVFKDEVYHPETELFPG